jgi:sarcosine oxidase subunit beta
MGASVAFHLAKLGVTDVVLLEREPQLGAGSTGRNAGGVRHQFSHDANIRLSIESIGVIANFAEVTGHHADFHEDGYLFLLSSDRSVAEFRANVERQRARGVETQWLSAGEAAALAPGLDVDGVLAATFCASDGIADPNGVTMGFARAAQAAGVRIERDTEVLTWSRGPRSRGSSDPGPADGHRTFRVSTTRGDIETPVLVNAAGPHAGAIGRMGGVYLPIEPYRRHIFIARTSGTVPSNRIMVIDFDTTFYFHREGAGVLFGMGDPDETPTFDMTVRWDFLPRVVETATRRLPALQDAHVSHAWAGLYEVTPDANPLIGAVPGVDGFHVIAGFSGHGFQHSPAAGRILADVIAGRDPGFDLSSFAPDRFLHAAASGERYVV